MIGRLAKQVFTAIAAATTSASALPG